MKKFLSIILSTMIILAVIPLGDYCLVADAEEENLFDYEIIDNQVTITRFNKVEYNEVVIPEAIDGLPVTTIGTKAFDNTTIYSLIIPKSITTIKEDAFYFTTIFKVQFLGTINQWASINFENEFSNPFNKGLFAFESTAFYAIGLSNDQLIFEEGLTEIKPYSFMSLYNIDSIYFPSTLVKIGELAFCDCSIFNELTIPASLKVIGKNAFSYGSYSSGLDNLTKLNYTGTINQWANITFENPCSNPIQCARNNEDFIFCINDTPVTDIVFEEGLTKISSYAFAGYRALNSVTIPEGVTEIGDDAFYNCYNLTEINYPQSVTHFGSNAYYRVSTEKYVNGLLKINGWVLHTNDEFSATEYICDDSFKGIAYPGFGDAPSSVALTLPENISTLNIGSTININSINISESNEYFTSVDGVLFNKNKNTLLKFPAAKTSVYAIPDFVTDINADAFKEASLYNITIPTSVTCFKSDTFADCSVQNIYYKGTVNQWASITFENEMANPLYSGGSLYINDSLVSNLCFDGGITEIKPYAFTHCSSIENVVVADSIEKISKNAFEQCFNLETVVLGNGVKTIEKSAFDSCEKLSNITFGTSLEKIGQSAFYSCVALEALTIPDSVTKIEPYAFASCSSITELTLSNNLSNIEQGVFAACINLKNINFGTGLKSISPYAFYYAHELGDIVLPEGFESIGTLAFIGCENIKNLTIPQSVKSIGIATVYGVFDDLTFSINYSGTTNQWAQIDFGLGMGYPFVGYIYDFKCNGKSVTNLTFDEGLTEINICAFYQFLNITSVSLPDSLEHVGAGAFAYSNINYVKFNTGLKTIGAGAFEGCTIESLDIPDSVTEIGAYAFDYCRNLKAVKLPESITEIKHRTFYKCAIKSINIPDKVEIIGPQAFAECLQLESVTLSNSVKEIDATAFENCTALKDIYFDGTYEELQSVFTDTSILEQYRLHCSTVDLSCDKVFVVSGADIIYGAADENASYQWYGCQSDDRSDAILIRGANSNTFNPIKTLGSKHQENKYAYYYCVKTVTDNSALQKTESPLCLNAFNTINETNYSTIDFAEKIIYSDSTNNINDYSNIIDNTYAVGVSHILTASQGNENYSAYGTGSTMTLSDSTGNCTVFDIVVYGDVNGDGVIDVLDCSSVANTANSISTLDGIYNTAADINGDGEINPLDYQTVVNKAIA